MTISKTITESYKKMLAKLDEAILAEQTGNDPGRDVDLPGEKWLDERDMKRIKTAQAALLYVVSTDDQSRVVRELMDLDRKWAMWATTGTWQVFSDDLNGRIVQLKSALEFALADELDADDDAKIAAARSRLVAAEATEDEDAARAVVDTIEKERAVWATSGTWPLTIKPSRPPREVADASPGYQDEVEAAAEVSRNYRIGGAVAALVGGWFLWRRR